MVNIERKGDMIVISFPVNEAARGAAQPSTSGKTLVLASTNGFTRQGDVSISLNATLPNPKYVAAGK